MCCVKITPKAFQDKNFANIEVQLLKVLDHPNIIKVFDVYETPNYEFIFMELCDQNLITTIQECQSLSELQMKVILRQLLAAVAYLHAKNIVHRDLKLDNILLRFTDSGLEVKLIDFGHSQYVQEGEEMRRICGSHYYIAPEILVDKGYGIACDMWSLGVVTFTCLTGHFPFDCHHFLHGSENVEEIFR